MLEVQNEIFFMGMYLSSRTVLEVFEILGSPQCLKSKLKLNRKWQKMFIALMNSILCKYAALQATPKAVM